METGHVCAEASTRVWRRGWAAGSLESSPQWGREAPPSPTSPLVPDKGTGEKKSFTAVNVHISVSLCEIYTVSIQIDR